MRGHRRRRLCNVTTPLRGDEIIACVHRVALSRGTPFPFERPPTSPEIDRRRRDAENRRRDTLEELRVLHPGAAWPTSPLETATLMDAGAELIFQPRLAADREGQRRTRVQCLVRVGRVDQAYAYAPVIIKNNEVTESATTRRTLEGSLKGLAPADAVYTDGVGVRSTPTVTRNGIILAHATRVLLALGHADPAGRVAMIDRHRQVWWFDLANDNYPRFSLSTYDQLYAQRLAVVNAHDEWLATHGDFPTSPYWHRECLECPFGAQCEEQLEAIDDVSLTRFTSLEQQLLLREHGIATRAELARLDPVRAHMARNKVVTPHVDFEREDHLGRHIERLDDLIYRARAHVRGSSLRAVDVDEVGCPTADVEVDVDMESYGETTYLWGAYVTLNTVVEGIEPGYRSFVEWGELDAHAEATIFADFWSWLRDLRARCDAQGRSVAAYCFWAQAEDGAMNRAVATPLDDGPSMPDLEAFRRTAPSQWIDLHEVAKRQVQTEGPLGLKQLAGAAGFRWRDVNPSGEASMIWYEEAIDGGILAEAARQRILEYNEDDCRATKALRDWLNGPARHLAHRDDPS
jgi:predicted RecB family nuclease